MKNPYITFSSSSKSRPITPVNIQKKPETAAINQRLRGRSDFFNNISNEEKDIDQVTPIVSINSPNDNKSAFESQYEASKQ